METKPLNHNPRAVRNTPEGLQVSSGRLCDACGSRDRCGVQEAPKVCDRFSPLLVFRPPLIGFDGWFNTFRLGRGTYDRFSDRIGMVFTLYEKRKERILGHAQLTGVACGPMEMMLERYAWSNHLSLGRSVDKADAPAFLRQVLLRNYKTMFKTSDMTDKFTVLFLARCSAQAPQQARQELPRENAA